MCEATLPLNLFTATALASNKQQQQQMVCSRKWGLPIVFRQSSSLLSIPLPLPLMLLIAVRLACLKIRCRRPPLLHPPLLPARAQFPPLHPPLLPARVQVQAHLHLHCHRSSILFLPVNFPRSVPRSPFQSPSREGEVGVLLLLLLLCLRLLLPTQPMEMPTFQTAAIIL